MFKKKKKINPRIINYVESFFDGIQYSKEIENTKEKIILRINKEYIKEKEKNNKKAFETIVRKYHNLETMVESVNIDKNIIKNWYEKEVTTSIDDFKKIFMINKRQISLATILGIISFTYLIDSILHFYNNFTFLFIVSLVFLITDIIYIIIIKRRNKNNSVGVLSIDDYQNVEKLFDKYGKKSIIWLMILFIKIFDLALNLILLKVNSKTYEIMKTFTINLFIIECISFFFIKNKLIMNWLNKKIDFEKEKQYKKSFRKVILFSLIYCLLGGVLFYVFQIVLVINVLSFLRVVYLFGIIVYYLFKTKKFTYYTSKMTKPVIVITTLFVIFYGGYTFLSRDIWLTQPYINSINYIYESDNKISYDDTTGVYTITKTKEDFKILQLTDIHLGGSFLSYEKDLKALKAVYKLIDYTKPDLVVVTGDLTFPMGYPSFSFNNTAPVGQFAAFMRNTGVPWVFTYGNHDTESIATANKESLDDLYKSLSWKTSKNLLYPYTQPGVWGRNNQLIEIRNKDNTLNQALFLIDSNAYTGDGLNKYDYIHDDQVNWYKENVLRLNKEENKNISSLVFFHIPLQEYITAYELYLINSDEVKYYFGSNDEKICASYYNSSMFDVALELKSTKGFFCGHDHYNNMSLEYKGIRLTYGMSIDYLVMPGIAKDTKQRGATLITSHADSSIDIEQIPLTLIEEKENDS